MVEPSLQYLREAGGFSLCLYASKNLEKKCAAQPHLSQESENG